jgi:hypothetical protein
VLAQAPQFEADLSRFQFPLDGMSVTSFALLLSIAFVRKSQFMVCLGQSPYSATEILGLFLIEEMDLYEP